MLKQTLLCAFFLLFLFLPGLLIPVSSLATTIIPFKHLAELYLACDAAVVVQSVEPYEQIDGDCIHNYCEFKVLTSAKGPLLVNEVFTLRQYSYSDQTGRLDITGDFIPKTDHKYMLFLDQADDGSWHLMMLSYYVFEETLLNNAIYLFPVEESLSIGVFPRPDGVVPEPLTAYREDMLLQLLKQQDKAPNIPWDPSAAKVSLSEIKPDQVSDRAIPVGCDFDMGGGLSRWQNPTINMYYDVTNAPSDAAARFQGAIDNLNTQYSGLNLLYGGSTDFTPECSDRSVVGQDFINFTNANLSGNQSILLLFEDPCELIPNLTNCSGTLALGGGYMLSTSHSFKGDTWKNAAWGYVFTNNGVRACLSATSYELMLTHELTHSLKMDHLDPTAYPNNNMNPICCNPINNKDRECMNYVYDSPLPVELISFDARAQENMVTLSWSTAQEVNNDHFIVERSADALRFEILAQVEASNLAHAASYKLSDERPLAGTNYYRLSQMDRNGHVEQLGIRAVNYKGDVSGYSLVPNPANGNSIVLKSVIQTPAFESLQMLNPAGKVIFQMPDNSSWNQNGLEIPLGDLPPGLYWLKVNEGGKSETLKFVRL